MRTVERPLLHREDNAAYARAYGKTLRSLLQHMAIEPSPAASSDYFVEQMQDAARTVFQAAFRRGKWQASTSNLNLSSDDLVFVERRLELNARFLRKRLLPDVISKISDQGLNHPSTPTEMRLEVMDRSFGSRLENHYGGILWQMSEAGFRSGVKHNSIMQEKGSFSVGVKLICEDDAKSCDGCICSAGFYFPSHSAPLPGDICTGGGNCRCYYQIAIADD